MFFEVILPVVHMKNTVLICISSPSDEHNWFSKCMTLQDENGNPVLFGRQFTHVCEDVRAENSRAKTRNCETPNISFSSSSSSC
jgi:hypothetical protein